jgi:thiamine biosynthesis protein ThiS
VQIVLNGEPKTLADGATVADLVRDLGLQPKFVAVERNETLVPRTNHAGCVLAPDDRVEIVTLVGGG